LCWRYVFLVILRQLLQKRPGGIFVFAVMVVWISKEVRFVICSCPSLLTCSTIYFCAYLPSWFFFKCMFGASLTKSTSMVFQCVRKWWKEKKNYPEKKRSVFVFYQNDRFRKIHMLNATKLGFMMLCLMPVLRDLFEKTNIYFLRCCRFVMLFLLQESWTLHLFCLSWMRTPSGMMTGICFKGILSWIYL